MLLVPLPRAVPITGPATKPPVLTRMSGPEETPSLLWVNKDASNLHSKKHVAEVNAHVQKRGSRANASRRSIRKTSTSSSRDSKASLLLSIKRSSMFLTQHQNRRRKSESPVINSHTTSPRQTTLHAHHELPPEITPVSRDRLSSPLYQSVIQRSSSPAEIESYIGTSLGIISQLAHAEDHFSHQPTGFFDTSSMLPNHLSHLSSHDQMLIRTYLSYVPQPLYGPLDNTVYCPVRYARVTDMVQDSLGLLWILIAIDMFLAKARGDLKHNALILHRKDEAYRLMADRLKDPNDSQSLGFIAATASAAVTELFFGESSSALLHMKAIDAILQSQGGKAAIARLPVSVSIPLLNVFAYRSLLQDNLLTASTFGSARSQFKELFHAMLLQNHHIRYSTQRGSSGPILLYDEISAHGILDTDDKMLHFQEAKERAFLPGAILRQFIEPDFSCSKASDSVDHFLFLYNLNIALYDFARCGEYGAAARFLEDLMQDVVAAQANSDADSLLKISGVRCLFVARHAKAFGIEASEGVTRAWQAIDGLEILKLLSPTSRDVVYQSLSGMLTFDESKVMSLEMLEAIDMECATTWWSTAGLQELSSI